MAQRACLHIWLVKRFAVQKPSYKFLCGQQGRWQILDIHYPIPITSLPLCSENVPCPSPMLIILLLIRDLFWRRVKWTISAPWNLRRRLWRLREELPFYRGRGQGGEGRWKKKIWNYKTSTPALPCLPATLSVKMWCLELWQLSWDHVAISIKRKNWEQ